MSQTTESFEETRMEDEPLKYFREPLEEVLLRSARADYDTITIRPEVNGHVEPLTDPYVRLPIYDDVLLTETKY